MIEPSGPKKPERKIVLEVKIGADSWRDAADALAQIEQRILIDGPINSLISGGHDSGYIVTGRENPDQTGDKFRSENAEYVDSLKRGGSLWGGPMEENGNE